MEDDVKDDPPLDYDLGLRRQPRIWLIAVSVVVAVMTIWGIIHFSAESNRVEDRIEAADPLIVKVLSVNDRADGRFSKKRVVEMAYNGKRFTSETMDYGSPAVTRKTPTFPVGGKVVVLYDEAGVFFETTAREEMSFGDNALRNGVGVLALYAIVTSRFMFPMTRQTR